MIFGMIVRQYRLLIQMREHLDSGGTVGSASQALNMSSYVAKKMGSQVRHYRLDQLERVYRHLFEIDTQIKNGEIEPRLALEKFIARMSKSKQPA
jgi:DNA polymerase-3 subunit delta